MNTGLIMHRRAQLPPTKPGRGPNGRRWCRWCGEEVPQGRITWCGDDCVDEYKLRSDPATIRRLVLARDHGLCRDCGRDCVCLYRRLLAYLSAWTGVTCDHRQFRRAQRMRGWMRRLGLKSTRDGAPQTLWEAEHVVAVVLGGGGCGLDNLATLCVPCHKRSTRQLAAKRAHARRQHLGGGT